MDYKSKQKLFAGFMDQWGEQFVQVQAILNYLSSYSLMLEKTRHMGTFIKEEIEEKQLEWISLIAQLDHPLDRKSLKSYWVPVFEDSYDFFIDISVPEFPIFEICFFFLEPYAYYCPMIVLEMDKTLASLDENEDYVHELFKMHKKDKKHLFHALYKQHELMENREKMKK